MDRKAKALEFIDTDYNIQITGRHIEITDAMKDYATDKISKIERFVNRIITVNVIMDIQKLEQRVEIILNAGNIKIVSQATSTDIYSAIDKAVNKLEAQILRYKSKIQDHHAKAHAVVDMKVHFLNRPSQALDGFEVEEEYADHHALNHGTSHQVVKQKTLPLKILTYDEAVMKMELSGDAFLIFKNEVDQKLKVIYRRDDDNYGIIEPS